MRKLLLIGGGGHCHSVIDSVIALGLFNDIGIVDSNVNSCLGVPVIGDDHDIPELRKTGWNEAFITVGSIGNTSIRRKLYDMVKYYNFIVPIIIDPTAIIAKGVGIQEGSFIGKKTVINTGTSVGVCSIINTGSLIEHDCLVGDFVHVSSGSTICGQVRIGNNTHVGAGSVIRQGIEIGEKVLIGVGSVVVKDVPDNVKAYGNPCRVVQ